MALEDFEKSLATSNDELKREDRERKHRHHHRSKRPREEDGGERRHKRRRSPKAEEKKVEDDEDDWVEKEAVDSRSEVKRDAWMQAPSAMDIEFTQSRRAKAEEAKSQFVGAKQTHDFKVDVHQDLQNDFEDDGGTEDEPAQREVDYTVGDAGSSWRMTKLAAVYRQAEEGGKSVDDVALERYGDLRDFDDAREESRELDRRKMYGKDYVGVIKPSGDFFEERKLAAGLHWERQQQHDEDVGELPQGEIMPEQTPTHAAMPLDMAALNRLKAAAMKAKLKNAPNAAQLEAEYELAASATQPSAITLNTMDSRTLAGGRTGEVTAVSGKRALERGTVVENEDMSIADMVKQEKRSRGTGGGREFADRIAKDGKFKDDLEYMDDNAQNLSKRVLKSDTQLRNTSIEDYQKTQAALQTCPLCYHEETDPPQPPTAPVVSLATRTYLTLLTEPEIGRGGAVIVPIQHRKNLLECDDDEWEEIRNFMKSLTRYYASLDRGVVFYENAAHPGKGHHAALFAVPLPWELAETAPAYFKEAILAGDELWGQHKPLIDTLALSRDPTKRYGRFAFRKALAKEMPYFHVWFSVDGGIGHVVEDQGRWPKGDLFAREVLGGMMDVGPSTIKRQGRWVKGDSGMGKRVEGFRKRWGEFDWTRALLEG
ncbi:Pre-mRNA-splicing factor cwf19 [Elasticomyces elasticus]|nr:Pre-mRNA-splicing factor cwf19 [Elasticomyces elasticus]KAK3663554.1 Pre-mRNA-splicing factor cwf19 [Elasticomyces elasticus]KAK4923576.1 Pre-mRNA-splicing factor cwf19 [Elasticomyces elasticus]KAK5751590.1 Pre-mRNA-splicing factor cwf19 [Elasticomyces elasticus]